MSSSVSLSEAFDLAVRHHQAGHLGEAEALYRQILQVQPGHAETLYLLGRVEHQKGRYPQAVTLLEQAIAANGSEPTYYNNLGEALRVQAKLPEATAAYREALRLKSDYPLAWYNLANSLEVQGALTEAEAAFRRAIEIKPAFAAAHNGLGSLLRQQQRWSESRASFIEAIRLEPDQVEAHNNLGNVLRGEGRLAEAIVAYRRALQLQPAYAAAHFNLGIALRSSGAFPEALAEFEAAARLDPDDVEALVNLGAARNDLGQVDEAIAAYRQAIKMNPGLAVAQSNLGVCLQAQGQLEEAIDCYRTAIRLDPDDGHTASNLLYALNYQPANDPAHVFAEHRRWAERHADPLMAGAAGHTNDRTSNRRLRVGYVSSHFREHAVNFFSEPILSAHDHVACEVFCYADAGAAQCDRTTDRLRGYADHWRDICGLGDRQVGELIRRDQIDVLVDLAGHIGGNRLLVFARKPAPVQVTYIGYQNTTGMRAMDYRLTDAWADPPGTTESHYTERLVRLPRSFFCYLPSHDAPPVGVLPAKMAGSITFGSFNNLAKVTPQVLATWAKILLKVADSRMIVLGPAASTWRRYVSESFQRHGVRADRIELATHRPRNEYLELIQRADIALDAFPFNGHTTTCDCLWQGVPVVMLAGQTYVSRFGGSALVNLDLRDLITETSDDYVERAARLAGDLDGLESLRSDLRGRMANSPIVDAIGFTRNLEAAYRQMWIEWCANHTD